MKYPVWLAGMVLVLLLGALARWTGLGAEFWLDEILSWQLARQAGSPLGVFLIKHDNNHHLNTAWLTCWPDASSWLCYRLLSLLAGLTTIVVSAWVACRWGKADGLFSALLFAACYWLVVASTEARGYALVVLFALVAYETLSRYLDQRKPVWLLSFWVATILGFLSHLSFVHAYVGFIVWSLRRFARERQRPGEELWRLVLCHAGIIVFFAPFYLFCIRGMEVAGGPPEPLLPVLGRLVVIGLGGPAESGWAVMWLIGFAGLLVAGLWSLYREKNDVWVFFVVAVVASPALFLLRPPPFVFERYFLISFVFFLILAGHVLGAMWRAGRFSRAVALVLLVISLVGSAVHVHDFSRVGRGQFVEALTWVLEQDQETCVTVAGDLDFRVRSSVEFHARYRADRNVVYIDRDHLGGEGTEWWFEHRLDERFPPGEEVRDEAGNRYRQVRAYPSRGRGAWGWFVYRRVR
jgi:uncharacterized membrane protein